MQSELDFPGIPVSPCPKILRACSPVLREDGVRGVVLEAPKGQRTFSLVLWFYGDEEGRDGPVWTAAESLYLDLSDRTGVQHALWWLSDELFADRTRHPHLGCGVSWAPRGPCGNIRNTARGWDSIPGWTLTVESVDEVWSFDARWPEDVDKDERGTLVTELAGLPAPNDWRADEKIHTEVGMRLVDIEALRRVIVHRLVNVYGYKDPEELYEDDPTIADPPPEFFIPSVD